MKTFIITITILILFQFTFAQYTETLNYNSLVNARDLPEDVLLFVPDTTTQILFNPSRGASYK